MTNIVNVTAQNSKVENSESKNSNKSEPESSFLSIMQSQIEKANATKTEQNGEENLNSNKESLALVAKKKLDTELKKLENLSDLKSAKNIQDLIKVANEKGLKVKEFKLKKVDSEKLTEIKTLKNLNNLNKLKEKEINLENEKLLALDKLSVEKVTKEKSSILASLLQDGVKQEGVKDNSKEVLSGAFNLESLLQKDENKIGKKVKRDKFIIETLKQDKLEGVDVKKEISLDLRLDGNGKAMAEIDVKNKMVDAKATINSFASTLKEQVQEYKPPIMKLSLSLNPKELGNVDVTLLSRGNSLQINLASNNQAMQLFAQNAAEFKNALANMGFDNVEMNFNSHGDQSGQSQGNQDRETQRGFKYYADGDLNFSLEELESLNSIDLVIPQYA